MANQSFVRSMVALLVLHSATIAAAAAATASYTNSTGFNATINWSPCPSSLIGVDCATVRVPLAYRSGNSTDAASNQTITVGLARLNATGNSTEGVLFVNPGGPGVPASSYVSFGPVFPPIGFSAAVRERFDIIGLDPRGYGLSQPVRCDPSLYNQRLTRFVTNESEYKALKRHNRRLGQSCANLTGPLFNHLDTLTVAKDHEVVRRALGLRRFNFFGQSYGTLLGSQFLSLFPSRVGRMALDAIVDHTQQSEVLTVLAEATAYEATLGQWFDWCDRNSTCALHGRNVSSRAVWDAVAARAATKPIPAPGCNGTCRSNVSAEDFRDQAQLFLYFYDLPTQANWLGLGEALAQAYYTNNATLLSVPLATDTSPQTPFNAPFAALAIQCQDWLHGGRNATDIKQRLTAVRPFAPRTRGSGQMYYVQSNCLGWPAPLTNPQAPLNRRVARAPKVLLSNSVYDPTCSIAWANALREQLPSAVSVTRNGTGHTSHILFGQTRDAIDKYLATGVLPKDGTVYQS